MFSGIVETTGRIVAIREEPGETGISRWNVRLPGS